LDNSAAHKPATVNRADGGPCIRENARDLLNLHGNNKSYHSKIIIRLMPEDKKLRNKTHAGHILHPRLQRVMVGQALPYQMPMRLSAK